MELSDLVTLVAAKVQKTDSASIALMKSWASTRYQMIWNDELWKDSLSIYTFNVAASQSQVLMPAHTERIVNARFNATGLLPVEQSFLFSANPLVWDQLGTVARFSKPAAVGTKAMPSTSGERVSLVSSDGADTAKTVSIYGELAGVEQSETLQLNGTTPVLSVNSYDIIYGLSKVATTGSVTATGQTSSTVLQTFGPTDRQKLHPRLQLHPTPNVGFSLAVLAKRKANPLVADTDVTLLAGVDRVLEAFVHYDALEWLRQTARAQSKLSEATALLQRLKNEQVYQEASMPQILPYDAQSVADEGSWLTKS